MNKFDNISKGKWAIDKWNKPLYNEEDGQWDAAFLVKNNEMETVAQVYAYSFFNTTYKRAKAHAELIAFAGNLAQKYNIEHFEDVVEALKKLAPVSERLNKLLKLIEKE